MTGFLVSQIDSYMIFSQRMCIMILIIDCRLKCTTRGIFLAITVGKIGRMAPIYSIPISTGICSGLATVNIPI